MTETEHAENAHDPGEPYTLIEIPKLTRFFKASLAAIPTVLGLVHLLGNIEEKGNLACACIVGAVGIFGIYKLGKPSQTKQLRHVKIPYSRLERQDLLVVGWIWFMVGEFCLIAMMLFSSATLGDFIVLNVLALGGLAWYVVSVFMKVHMIYQGAEAVAAHIAHAEALERRALIEKRLFVGEEILNFWPVRYSAGAAMFGLAYWAVRTDANNWLLPTVLVIGAFYLMREVSKWLLGIAFIGGVAYALFGIASALPVGAAIIIGALIIANSKK